MAEIDIRPFLELVPAMNRTPEDYLWASYDREADVVYINIKEPSRATDSELREDDIIIRYEGDNLVGLTILHASQR